MKKNATAKRSKTDWDRLRTQTDKEIERAVENDPDAAPILDKSWFRAAELLMPQEKIPVTVRIDKDVLEWFKAQGKGYQTRMNAVLRAFVVGHR